MPQSVPSLDLIPYLLPDLHCASPGLVRASPGDHLVIIQAVPLCYATVLHLVIIQACPVLIHVVHPCATGSRHRPCLAWSVVIRDLDSRKPLAVKLRASVAVCGGCLALIVHTEIQVCRVASVPHHPVLQGSAIGCILVLIIAGEN